MRGRPAGSANIPWDRIVARLREQPGVWMLLPEMRAVSARTMGVIRKRERRALRLDDGVIRYRMKAPPLHLDDDGIVIVTLHLKFDPKD